MKTVVVKIDIFGVDGSKPYPKEMQLHDHILGELCKFHVQPFVTLHHPKAPYCDAYMFTPNHFVVNSDTLIISMKITESDVKYWGIASHLGVDKEAMRKHMESVIQNALFHYNASLGEQR